MNRQVRSLMQSSRPLIKNGIWMGLRHVIALGIGMIFTIMFARIASKETYGQYQLVLSIIATISVVSISGLNTSVLQSVARGYEGIYTKAVKISFKWSVILGTPILAAISVYFMLNQQFTLGFALILASLFFPALYATNTWESFVQGKERFDLFAKYSIARTTVNTALLVASLLFFKDNLPLLILSYLISISASNFFFYKKTKKLASNEKEDVDSIKYGWFLTKINALNSIFFRVDYLLVGYFLGIEELAIYSVGISLGTKIKDFFKVIFSVMSPKIARKGFDNKKNYLILFIVLLILAIFFFLIMPSLIRFIFSEKYNDSVYIAQIFVLFLPFFMIDFLAENHLSFFNKNKKIILSTNIIGPIVKFLLMLLLFKFYNIVGLVIVNGLHPLIRMLVIISGFRILKYFRRKL